MMIDDELAVLDGEFDLRAAAIGLPPPVPARRIGEILGERLALAPGRIAEILAWADAHDLRFGDAAVALGHASAHDVVQALSVQFKYAGSDDAAQLASPELPLLARPHGAQSEALRALRSRLSRRLAQTAKARGAVAVVSPEAGDGKTFLVANLGVAFAQTGARTLVVDADMRGPRLHEIFELRQRHGLSGAVIGCADSQIIQPVAAVPGLYLLACGAMPPNPLELVERRAFGSLLQALPQHFDHVLVDTPAASYGADALAIADRCAASLVLGRRHHSGLPALRRLAAELGDSGGPVLGTIVNDF